MKRIIVNYLMQQLSAAAERFSGLLDLAILRDCLLGVFEKKRGVPSFLLFMKNILTNACFCVTRARARARPRYNKGAQVSNFDTFSRDRHI